ncbi:FAD-dependent monooxygenase [Streptomyces sp. NPDC002835]
MLRLRSWPGLARQYGLDSRAYRAHVCGQSGGVAPCRFLCFEVFEAVRLGVLDAGFFHGGFPADALDPDQVTATLATAQGTEQVSAAYLVGCDGAAAWCASDSASPSRGSPRRRSN